MTTRKIIFALTFVWILLYGCANKVAPTGGPKDITPPEILESEPENNAVNFQGKEIVINFDEYIALKDLNKQVVVSPPIEPKPKISVRKKSIVVELEGDLRENTTYTINFGNAIVDTHEENPLTGFRYIFSTGAEIDSLEIAGTVMDALTRKPVSDAVVMLYNTSVADTAFLNSIPDYFTRSDATGNFKLQNIKQGAYRLFALADENSNFIFDSDKELVGFIPGTILSGIKEMVNVSLFRQYPSKQMIKDYKQPVPGKLITTFSRPVEDISWEFPEINTGETLSFINNTRDTITLYCTTPPEESFSVVWKENQMEPDTITYQIPRKQKPEKNQNKPFAGYITYPVKGSIPAAATNPKVLWDFPIIKTDTSKITLYRDSVAYEYTSGYTDSLKTKLEVRSQWKTGSYELIVLPEAVTDLHGYTNDTIKITFSIPEERSKGTLSYKISADTSLSQILQLVNEKDEVIRVADENKVPEGIFEMLDPGTYYLRMIRDVNGNRRYDDGDYTMDRLPESVKYYQTPVVVRANWEVEIEWKAENIF